MELGSKIAARRESKGWSTQQLANKLGVPEETVAQWESGATFPRKVELMAIAGALKIKVDKLLGEDVDAMMHEIGAMQMRETVAMGVLSVLTVASAAALVALRANSPQLLDTASIVTQVLIAVVFVAIILSRRSDAAQKARLYSEALEIIDGSSSGFILKRVAGKNPGLTALQFVLGAVIAFTLIQILGVLMPESNLPWVML